jgi:hypothetical protein
MKAIERKKVEEKQLHNKRGSFTGIMPSAICSLHNSGAVIFSLSAACKEVTCNLL